MAWKMDFSKTVKGWLKDPRHRWNAGLTGAGTAFVGEMQKYPPKSTRSYKRTGTLGNKSKFVIKTLGREVGFWSTYYAKFLLLGTGIFGPNRVPIRPKMAKLLAWKVPTGGKKGGEKWVFAKQVRGTIWAGKLDKVVAAVKKGFISGIKYFDKN